MEEQVDLDSEDEEFFSERNTDSVASDSSSCSSDSEEHEEEGVLDETELQRRVVRSSESNVNLVDQDSINSSPASDEVKTDIDDLVVIAQITREHGPRFLVSMV